MYNELYFENKKDKLSPKIEEKLISEIGLIYNFKDKQCNILSSLKK